MREHRNMRKLTKKAFKNRRGATAIEYAIMASLLSVVIIMGAEFLGTANQDNYDNVAEKINDALETASGDE